MTNRGVEQKPSETALFAALRRTIAHKEFKNDKFGPDDLSEYFIPPHFRFFLKFKRIRENTKNKLNRFLPGLNEYMIARTSYFDRLYQFRKGELLKWKNMMNIFKRLSNYISV